jgi:hypothetical protein
MREPIPSETTEEVRMGAAAFAYEACDIPPGMTIAEYRRSRGASTGEGLQPRDVTDRKARRRAWLPLPARARPALAAGVEA